MNFDESHRQIGSIERIESELVQPGKAYMRLRARPVRPESGLEARRNPLGDGRTLILEDSSLRPERSHTTAAKKSWHDGKDDYALKS